MDANDRNRPRIGKIRRISTDLITGHKNNKLFIEFDLPVRFRKPSIGNNVTAVTFAIHVGQRNLKSHFAA
jgi:hypothetical protein